MLLLSACGGGTDSNASKTQIDVKGVFLLEPSDQLNLSAEGLDTVQRYLFAVYDVDNSENDSNVDLSGFSDAVEVTLNDTNTYEQCSGSTLIRNFIDNSGYTTPGECGTLWGGSEPVRMISAFAVNQNDMKDGCTAKLNFNLSLNRAAAIYGRGCRDRHSDDCMAGRRFLRSRMIRMHGSWFIR